MFYRKNKRIYLPDLNVATIKINLAHLSTIKLALVFNNTTLNFPMFLYRGPKKENPRANKKKLVENLFDRPSYH